MTWAPGGASGRWWPRRRGIPDLAGRRILVTGGSSGIGAAAAAALAEAGASVAVNGRDANALEAVAASWSGPTIPLDLLEPGAPDDVVAKAAAALGGLDTLVCAAGTGWVGPTGEMTAEDVDILIDLNVRVPLQMVRAALPELRAGQDPGIVLMGSITGLVGAAREAVYSSTKAALATYADALRFEVGRQVAVSVIHPGAVATPFFVRRNRPYERRWPRPVPPTRVARAVVDAVATGRPSIVVPWWMQVAARFHGLAPGAYGRVARRFS